MTNLSPWAAAGQMPTSRYVMPQFEERTPFGFKRQDPYTKLFEDRVIFLGVQVDDTSADDVMAQLLVLESQDPDRDITLYINSPGGSFTAMTAIYDTMQFIRPEIQTVCLGQAASAASVLLAAGTPGKRLALPLRQRIRPAIPAPEWWTAQQQRGEEDHHRHDRDTPRHDGAGIGPLGVLDHGREDARSTDHPEQRNVLMEGELHLLIHLRSRRFFREARSCGLRPL